MDRALATSASEHRIRRMVLPSPMVLRLATMLPTGAGCRGEHSLAPRIVADSDLRPESLPSVEGRHETARNLMSRTLPRTVILFDHPTPRKERIANLGN